MARLQSQRHRPPITLCLVVVFDDQDGAGRAAAPAHFAELVGAVFVQERRAGVRHSVHGQHSEGRHQAVE